MKSVKISCLFIIRLIMRPFTDVREENQSLILVFCIVDIEFVASY